jgi:hypothetical protein
MNSKQHINRMLQPDIDRLCTSNSAQDLIRLRSALLRLTKGSKKARLIAVARAANVSESFIKYCYESGLLKGYRHECGYDGGFFRMLQLVIDNT